MTKFLITDQPRVSPGYEPSEESLGELLLDCHIFLSAVLERQHSKRVGQDAQRLLARLDELVEWETVH